jgi:phenol 2-monooxygenase
MVCKSIDSFLSGRVRQGIVDNFYVHDSVLLAGDSCHTHSSSAAQGLNTGIGDAINLGWKLGGVIKGWYDASVLQTYHTERRSVAEELIRLDKWYSTLINNKIPTDLIGVSTDPNVVLSEALERSMQFTIGLGIGYDLGLFSKSPTMGQVEAGLRAPDALVYRPGNHFTPLRLLSLLQNWGCFWVIVFAGQTLLTRDHLVRLHEYLDSDRSFAKSLPAGSVKFLTVMAGFEADGTIALGGQAFGKMYQDWDHTAHLRYGVPTSTGAIAVVRPDGYMGFATTLDEPEAVEGYFQRFIKGYKPHQATNGAAKA